MNNKIADRSSQSDPLQTPQNATDFFKEIHHVFDRCVQLAGGPIDRYFTIGNYPICLRFAGPALVPLIAPALEHLASPPIPNPALTICIWESDSSHLEMPPPPAWSWDDYIVRGEVHGYNDDRIHTAFQGNTLSMLDAKLDLAIYWVRSASEFPYYESGSPLLRILHWWMRRHGRQLIHAGALGTAQGGVLLAGKGGSGKSTTALSSINSDLLYASDDYCLITAEPEPYVYSVFSSGKVNAEDIGRFPFLKKALSNPDRLETEKALFFLYKYFPEKIAPGFPIRAILLPRVTGTPETRVRKIPSAAGLLALAPSTIFQLPGAGDQAFRTLAELAKKTPSYVLEVGTNFSGIPAAILNLLTKLF